MEPEAGLGDYRQPHHVEGRRPPIYRRLLGIGGWIGLPVTAGLDLNDKFGAIGATAMTKAANLDKISQGGEFNVFRVYKP